MSSLGLRVMGMGAEVGHYMMEVSFCTYAVWRARAMYGVCSQFGTIKMWLLVEVCLCAWAIYSACPREFVVFRLCNRAERGMIQSVFFLV
jgi:hypothetical protein